MSFLPSTFPAMGSALTATFINTGTSTSNETTYDFGNFLAASAGLMVVVFLARGGTSRTVASISIGGTNGTLITGTTANRKTAIAYRAVSAGNNNVTGVLSGSNGANSAAIVGVHLLTGYYSATPYASTSPDDAAAATSNAATINLPAGGFAAFGLVKENSETITWSSATEHYDQTLNSNQYSHASINRTKLTTSHIETASWSASRESRIIAASWR